MNDTLRPIRNRSDFIEALEELRRNGTIDMADEGSLLRHHDALVEELKQEKQRLLVEYEQRCAQDGNDAADAWLAEQARALGQRHQASLAEAIARCGGFQRAMQAGAA